MPDFSPDKMREAHKKAMERMLHDAKFASGQKQAQRNDKNRRDFAEKRDAEKPVFLRPNDLAGEYDFSKTLLTTIGGKLRPITKDDIKAFAHNVEVAKDKYKKGITPQQVIDWSLAIDRERTNKQIHLCAPFSRKAGVQRFITNASEGSPDKRHYVTVEFNNFAALVTAPRKVGAKLSREQLANGTIKFDCDCGRHTFWFRYLATIGKYASGRLESGFPKVRNPNLQGVACKHVLRVMQFITSPSGVQYMRTQVDKDRNAQLGQTLKETEAQIKQRLAGQVEVSHHKKQKVTTQDEREQTPAYQRQKARADERAVKKAQAQAAKDAARKQAEDAAKMAEDSVLDSIKQKLSVMEKSGLFSPEELAVLQRKLK